MLDQYSDISLAAARRIKDLSVLLENALISSPYLNAGKRNGVVSQPKAIEDHPSALSFIRGPLTETVKMISEEVEEAFSSVLHLIPENTDPLGPWSSRRAISPREAVIQEKDRLIQSLNALVFEGNPRVGSSTIREMRTGSFIYGPLRMRAESLKDQIEAASSFCLELSRGPDRYAELVSEMRRDRAERCYKTASFENAIHEEGNWKIEGDVWARTLMMSGSDEKIFPAVFSVSFHHARSEISLVGFREFPDMSLILDPEFDTSP